MDYRKPSKAKANEEYLRQMGILKKVNPYSDEELEQKKLFLIVCEGDNTEPAYFASFPVPTKTVLIEGGCGSKTSLVEYALKLSKEDKYAGREIWCVFDFDVKPDEAKTQAADFNNAIIVAEQNNMKVAWSNDAFELWFVLHYQQLTVTLSRHQLYDILKGKWELKSFHNEAKTWEFCNGHYQRHGGDKSDMQTLAIRRAREIHEQYGTRKDFANHCPCTTVYLLVEELNKNLKG